MRRLGAALLALLAWRSAAGAGEAERKALPAPSELTVRVAALLPRLIELRRELHMHPELSNREVQTGALIAARMRALGLEVKEHVAGNGVVAILRGGKPGPVVAVRADIDALPIDEPAGKPYRSQNPGVKHACGHDVHMTIAVGLAELLVPLKDSLPGTLKLIFQPAEEGPPPGERGGAALMIAEGALEAPRPVAILGLHVWPLLEVGTVAVRSGPAMASADRFTLTVSGKKTHGAQPQNGIDAVVVASELVTALQTIRARRIDPAEPFVLSIGSIQGGNRFNIIADEVKLEGTIRALDPAVRKRGHALLREIAAGITSAHGATFKLELSEVAPLTVNDDVVTPRVRRSLELALGPSQVLESPRLMVSEDFGFFQQKIPGTYYFLGVANKKLGITAMVHTPAFEVDESAIGVGVRAMAEAVLGELTR